ncbi:MAG: YihA family ribosome biogenesis GTP-binding protein [Clostridia bacterium]|nr:YihA family ribosome biogenesis GTP-binding protein [Clostridia bacterium]MBR2407296.1 YihA family ribosome biogenesis GTP-binding protein [Clostridia bacterium]
MKIESAQFELSVGIGSQLPPSELPEVAVSGRSNVGKSSLINRVLNRKSLARTSATPGKTITVNFYRLDTMRLVDLPGYGYAKLSRSEKQRFSEAIGGYLGDDRDLRLVLQLIDMRHPPTADDKQMLEALAESGLPFVVVLTKSDKLNKSQREAQMAVFAEAFADYEGLQYIPFSSLNGEGVDELRAILAEVTEE